MAEYIERETLLNAIDKLPVADMCFFEGDVVDMAMAIPAADVVEVKHGEWIGSSFDMACSACGIYQSFHVGRTNYCPNCGAKMKG